MTQAGFHMDDVYQGENLTPVIHEADGLLRDRTLHIGKNNLLKAHFLNVAMKQNLETRKIRPVKIEPKCHIDGFVAVIDALTVRQKWYDQIGGQLKNEE
jgi:phage terminase large subunit-like protein